MNSLKMSVISLRVYPKLLNIYNYKNFKANKVLFYNSDIFSSFNNANS